MGLGEYPLSNQQVFMDVCSSISLFRLLYSLEADRSVERSRAFGVLDKQLKLVLWCMG
jgi:hypothetical protein